MDMKKVGITKVTLKSVSTPWSSTEIILRVLFHCFIDWEALVCQVILTMKLDQSKHHTIQRFILVCIIMVYDLRIRDRATDIRNKVHRK